MSLYDRDFHAWANEQAELARRRLANELDWDNVAEELESLGRREYDRLTSRYRVLLMHLLKWLYQPERRGSSWSKTIKEQRVRAAQILRKHPSLKPLDQEAFADAYEVARVKASNETDIDLDTFPVEPPFTPEQARDDDFWPDPDPPRT